VAVFVRNVHYPLFKMGPKILLQIMFFRTAIKKTGKRKGKEKEKKEGRKEGGERSQSEWSERVKDLPKKNFLVGNFNSEEL